MGLLQSLVIAMSMYSKIPVPRVAWTDKNLKYVMCFFPLVGGITGICVWFIGGLLYDSNCGSLFYAVVMTLLPVVLNGGIHMDGFLDTVDALSSYGDREKRLEILKDPHAGAFAVLWTCCYFLMSLGLWSETTKVMFPVLGWGFVLSRALSGLAIVAFPAAKNSGLARTFQNGADRRRTGIVLIGVVLISAAGMLWTSLILGGIALGCAMVTLLYYRLILVRQFGGITGDLAGYFLQLCELAMLGGVVLAGGLGK